MIKNMINYLLELGIDEKDIKNIMEVNKGFTDFDDYEKNVELLKMINCDDKEIRNIIISNPNVLIRNNNDILKLIKCFNKYGFTNLNMLFDSNPYLLNNDDFELVNYFNKKSKEGLSNEDIIDLLESNPYDFN